MQRVLLAGLQALDFVDFLGGYPLFYDLAVLVDDLDGRAFQFLAAGDVGLADLDVRKGIFDQEDAILRDRSFGSYLAEFIDREPGVCRDRVSVGCYCLMQRVGGTGLQAGRLMGLLGGYPLINDLAALIDDLDGRAFQFLAVCDIGLLHAYGCFVLVDEFRDLFAAVILDGSRQDAFIKIDHGHDSLLLGLVIDVTLLVLDDLPDGVVIGAGLLIADGREYDVPVRVIVNGVHRNAGLVVDQFEDELLVLQRPVLQRLEGLQGSRSRRLVSVGEYSGSAVINRGGCHRTVAVIHDCHCDTLLSRIKCIAVLSLNDFLNGIGVSALLRVLDRVEGDLSAVAILLRLFELAALIEFEAELFGLQDPAGLTGQFLQGFKDYRALCFVGVGNGQAILTIILDLCVQFVGAVLFRNSHNDLMRCRIIGNAACSTVLLSNRVLVSTGLLEGNIAEACLRGLLSCFCSGLTRHRCAFRHC